MIKSFKSATGAILGAFIAVGSIGSGVYDHYTTDNPNNDKMLPRVAGFATENIFECGVVIVQTIGEKGSEIISSGLEEDPYNVSASNALSRENTYSTQPNYNSAPQQPYQGGGSYYNSYDY